MDKLTIVTTLIAAIAPSVVAIINAIVNNLSQLNMNKQNNDFQLQLSQQNNNHQIQQKQLEHFYSQKTVAINDYIDNLSKYLHNENSETLLNYKLSLSKICTYVSKDIYSSIKLIDFNIEQKQLDLANSNFENLLNQLNIEAQQYHKAN